MLVECINDSNWHPEALKWIKNFPVKGEVYTVIKRTHTKIGLGYILEELVNDPLPCGTPVGFSAKRFKPVGDNDTLELWKQLQEDHYQTVDITEITEVLENEIVN